MNKIKLNREEINLNQYELAAATRGVVPRWKIQLAEAGHIDLTTEEQEAICYVFRKNIEEVFPNSGSHKGAKRRSRVDASADQQSFDFNKKK